MLLHKLDFICVAYWFRSLQYLIISSYFGFLGCRLGNSLQPMGDLITGNCIYQGFRRKVTVNVIGQIGNIQFPRILWYAGVAAKYRNWPRVWFGIQIVDKLHPGYGLATIYGCQIIPWGNNLPGGWICLFTLVILCIQLSKKEFCKW